MTKNSGRGVVRDSGGGMNAPAMGSVTPATTASVGGTSPVLSPPNGVYSLGPSPAAPAPASLPSMNFSASPAQMAPQDVVNAAYATPSRTGGAGDYQALINASGGGSARSGATGVNPALAPPLYPAQSPANKAAGLL